MQGEEFPHKVEGCIEKYVFMSELKEDDYEMITADIDDLHWCGAPVPEFNPCSNRLRFHCLKLKALLDCFQVSLLMSTCGPYTLACHPLVRAEQNRARNARAHPGLLRLFRLRHGRLTSRCRCRGDFVVLIILRLEYLN